MAVAAGDRRDARKGDRHRAGRVRSRKERRRGRDREDERTGNRHKQAKALVPVGAAAGLRRDTKTPVVVAGPGGRRRDTKTLVVEHDGSRTLAAERLDPPPRRRLVAKTPATTPRTGSPARLHKYAQLCDAGIQHAANVAAPPGRSEQVRQCTFRLESRLAVACPAYTEGQRMQLAGLCLDVHEAHRWFFDSRGSPEDTAAALAYLCAPMLTYDGTDYSPEDVAGALGDAHRQPARRLACLFLMAEGTSLRCTSVEAWSRCPTCGRGGAGFLAAGE